MNVSWNFPGQGRIEQLGVLALLLIANNPGAEIVFFCKMGEVPYKPMVAKILLALRGARSLGHSPVGC